MTDGRLAGTLARRHDEPERRILPDLWRYVREYATALGAAWHTPELFDAARRRPAWQSSYDPSAGPPPLGPDGTYPNKEVHPTAPEVGPWWIVDLGEAYPVHDIRIRNRAGELGRNAAHLTVSVSTDQQGWHIVHSGLTHFGGSASPKPLQIRLLGVCSARYVRLNLPLKGVLRVRSVRVFVERRPAQSHWVRWRRLLLRPLLTLRRAWRHCLDEREVQRVSSPHVPPLVDVATRGKEAPSPASGGNPDHPARRLDLGAPYPIYLIRIHGRRGSAARTTARLMVSISEDGERWECVLAGMHFFGDPGAPGPLDIRLISSRTARFVKIELPEAGQMAVRRVEVLVERRLIALEAACRKYGFALPEMLPTSSGRPRYAVENAPEPYDGSVAALHITRVVGRFGNQLIMIATAVCLARSMGIGRVYLQPLEQFALAEPMEADGVTLLPQRLLARQQGAILGGLFYRKEAFGERHGRMSPDDIQWALRDFVRPLFRSGLRAPSLQVAETDLVIHLRAGDIFASPQPHPGYVQPPLSYYRLIVGHAQRTLGVGRVILVYEDDGNPCVGALKAWLTENDVPFIAQSASLAEDLSTLLQARCCVFGHGTFGPAIVSLSDRMRVVFSPWTTVSLPAAARAVGVQLILVRDVAGGYLQPGAWRGTPEQRRLMLDYPIENLALDDNPDPAGPSGLLPE